MAEQLPELPVGQPSLLEGNPDLLALLDGDCPVRRVRTATGDRVWIATRHAEVRKVYTHEQLGRTHPDPAAAARIGEHPVLEGPSDLYSHAGEHQQHKQMRRLLGGYFSPRHLRDLQPYIDDVAAELLDAMAGQTPPIDLHEAFSYQLPLRVLCELLGVPYVDRELFQKLVRRMGDLSDGTEAAAGRQELMEYLHRTVRRSRQHPETATVIAGLCAAGLKDEEVAGFASLLLFAGHDSTAFHIDAGTVLLLEHPAQFRRIGEHPELASSAVEEVLRTAGRDAMGFLRYARTRTELAEVPVERGEAVLPQLSLANFDDRVFDTPEQFDISRQPNPHLSFGHGPWHCLGAPLARSVLRTAFIGLATQFPNLRLAVPVDRIAKHDEGIDELPVRW